MKKRKITAGTAILMIFIIFFSMTFSVSAVTDSETADSLKDTVSSEALEAGTSADTNTAENGPEPITGERIADGVYEIEVDSSSSMFRVVKAVLTVEEGEMSAVLTLSGQGYGMLYMGRGEEAEHAEESAYIPFVEDAEGAYTYEVPVECLDGAVECAAWSIRKEKWYDRDLVFLSENIPEECIAEVLELKDGVYGVNVSLTGGTGRAKIASPAELFVENGKMTLRVEWDSPDYDYMLVNGDRYDPVNTKGDSVFEIPVPCFDREFVVIADTTAMSVPHEVEYALCVSSAEMIDSAAAKKTMKILITIMIVMMIAAAAGVSIAIMKIRKLGNGGTAQAEKEESGECSENRAKEQNHTDQEVEQ